MNLRKKAMETSHPSDPPTPLSPAPTSLLPRRHSRITGLALAGLVALAASACDDGTAGPGEDGGVEVDPAEVACESVAGVTVPIVAAEDHPGSSPGLDPESVPEVLHGADPYRVTMPASGTGYLRLVTTEADEELVLFLGSTSVLTEVYDETGAALGVVSAGANPFCESDIPDHFDLDFRDPGTYFLELTSAADVWLLLSEGEGHSD